MSRLSVAEEHAGAACVEQVEVRGHIIDSLILPKVLDLILAGGCTFRIAEMTVGQRPADPSYALLEVRGPDEPTLRQVLAHIADHGATPVVQHDCTLVPADMDGALPEDFYSTTNQRTELRLEGRWLPVDEQEMDCGILVAPDRRRARCIPMNEVRRGDLIVLGRTGVRVFPEERPRRPQGFQFMASEVSTEKPKGSAIRQIAREIGENRARGGRLLVVAGPAVIHTGSGPFLAELIRGGYVNTLFAGNALAAHDIEHALLGTSLGVRLEEGGLVEGGHAHHLRAINRIRRAGGIGPAVARGELRAGIMYECVRQDVPFVLAGSIRDDGPLPEVVTDVVEAQRAMRRHLPGVTFCLMLASTLHAVAVGNLLPAWVKVVCVDINPSTGIKLADRGSFQTLSLVTDVASFLQTLVAELTPAA